MTTRPEIRKNRETGKWTATCYRYGFTPGLESNTRLASHRDAVDWVFRSRNPSSPTVITELAHPFTDGTSPVPAWTPLEYCTR